MSHPKIISDEQYTYRTDVISAVTDRLESMIERHCKVFNPRFNLQFPAGYKHDGGNKEISKASNMMMASLKNKGIDAEYVWVREKHGSQNPHYHVSLMMDGSKSNNVWSIKSVIDDHWGRVLGVKSEGLQHIQNADNDYRKTMIRRPSLRATGEQLEEQQRRFEYAMSEAGKAARYMAKTFSKGDAPAHVREFQGSQIKKKEQTL